MNEFDIFFLNNFHAYGEPLIEDHVWVEAQGPQVRGFTSISLSEFLHVTY